tara:strand:+ start:19 stop:270 length:252 start_codon:yes stop_codon:yes gene_type:complete
MIEYLKYLLHLIRNFFNPYSGNRTRALVKIDRNGNTHVMFPDDKRYKEEATRLELKRNNETLIDKVRIIFKNIFKSTKDRSRR